MKQFVAVLLCTCILRSAVGNTSLCENRCLIDYDNTLPCQCNDVCSNHGNCCSDYYSVGCNTASTSSCQDRCLVPYDSGLPCQCNDQCQSFGNCCDDFGAAGCEAIHGGTMTLSEFSEDLWDNDANRVSSSQYSYNRGGKLPNTSDKNDLSSSNFFSSFSSSILNGPTISKFYALLNNYIATEGTTESFTSSENNEIEAFLDAIFDTTVMEKTTTYLMNEGLVTSETDLRNKMDTMWFEPYNRQGTDDSSGFEHVFLGEWKSSTKVNGFHNWIQLYKEENEGDLNYYGYMDEKSPNLISMQFSWGSSSRVKSLTSVMLGASPEFEMAMFTTCFLKHKGSLCTFSLDGNTVKIQTYAQGTDQIGSAYFSV